MTKPKAIDKKTLFCRLGWHLWERIGEVKPIISSEQGFYLGGHYIGHFAMGRCEQCGTEALRRCRGEFGMWDLKTEVTFAQYQKRWDARCGATAY